MTDQYFLPISTEVESAIWKTIDRTKASAEKDIEVIKIWLSTQPHLPNVLSDKQISNFLFLGKGNMEKVKSKIDMYFTKRFLYPDIFSDSHPFSERILNASRFIYALPLPELDEDNNRVVVLKVKEGNPADMDLHACSALSLNMADIRIMDDFCNGHLIIFDMEHCKLAHFLKVTPTLARNFYNIGEKSLTTRVVAIHLINAPSFVDRTVLLIKSIVKPKLAERIIVHKDMKSVVESIDKHILPKDYGGYGDSLDELEAKFFKRYQVHRDYFDQREKWVVNEELRPSKATNYEFLGYYGNFRKLDVD